MESVKSAAYRRLSVTNEKYREGYEKAFKKSARSSETEHTGNGDRNDDNSGDSNAAICPCTVYSVKNGFERMENYKKGFIPHHGV